MSENWAISIGINQYDNLQSLNFAKRDAEAMAAWFREEAKFDQVFLFTEDSPAINTSPAIPTQPTYGRLRRFLQAQFEQPLLEPGDNLWFFFAGHGMRHADKDYLMLADSDPGDIEHTAISVEFITERLRRSRADNVVLFLDACREESSRSGLGIGLEQHQGVITFYSCAANQKSWEITELQHGSFTYTLLTGLRLHGEANCATVERLDRYLNSSVPKLNTRYQKEIQNPYLKAEPPYKMYYILLEQSATMKDVESLKLQASLSENAGNFELAEQIWIRVLGVSRADLDAVSAIKRIAIKKNNSTLLPISQPVPNSESASSSRGDATMSPTEILELAEKIKENNRKQEEYRQALLKEVEQQFPLNQKSIDNLSNLQKSLQLSEEEVSGIKQPIFIQKEAEYRKREEEERIRKEQQAERIRQQHQQNLEQYQREFSAKIEREYPLHQANRNRFKRLQNSLQLNEHEILQIEQPIIAKKEAEYQKLQEENRKTSGNSSGSNPPPIKRRQFLIYAGLGGTGLVTTVVFSQILKPTVQPKQVEPKQVEPKQVQPKLLELLTFTFTTKTVNKTGKIVNLENHQAKYFKEDLGNGITLEMVQIPGGSFMMGSPESEKDRYNNESPQHQVNVPGFSMGKFVVTQEQYQQIMGKNPSYFTEKGAKRPVEKVSWNNAVEFCQKLSEKTGREYRLPSEAEWEYACRGGTTTPFYFGETITTDLANYNGTYTYASEPKGKSLGQTTEVGSFPPNSFGLYDIHGNVWEWCQDDWHDNYANAPKDGSAWTSQSGNAKRLRGGSWLYNPGYCRSAYRDYNGAGFDFNLNGFRVVCGAAWTQ
ncbi:SUMF1/EgtB/PvdO family nonheme iron enzyme [Dolichospermum circinale]|uniref:SUMF1/EgtB/PvdO family nonheme iron enzyme n=1 Tax=Dolichospermum circinale TaxID=109265 RepID=UPI0005533087|nr:SUMF1/EgtB/PvdO family nonheme iron enzyme [Dolichospermum circinale]MDB9475871.1 SUMF1/EgtB/PvdO family nonheme iron enzyme [Dolichospermum circinale CS-537/11]MDB9477932.1 SUMF1/EgtB/PvdO family nonheme iron enzyme [Dolichospermum circinale CS-537/03]MDB9484163.1 SUMF1/EgtB/PvdO family nonheme iron enzyme [Dolichospermum circinale CS-537/05]